MKKIIIFLLLFISIIAQSQTTYYISNNGSDAANGLTSGTAWRTLTNVNATTFEPGDSILFKAGDSWRGTVLTADCDGCNVFYVNDSGDESANIYFGRYGIGVNPKLLGSQRAITWTTTATVNVWQTATSLANNSDDYYAGRIFYYKDDSVSYGDWKTYTADFSNLVQEYDYAVNGTTHYIYSATDPDTRYDSVEVTNYQNVFEFAEGTSYIEINGIDILFGRRANLYFGYEAPKGQTDIIIRNCNIAYCGSKGSGSAWGVALFHSNILIENCTFSDNGRRAISINTYTDAPAGRNIENIIIRNNEFRRGYHTTSLDLSTMNRNYDTVRYVYFYNNIVDDSDIDELTGSWYSNQLFTQQGLSTSVMTDIYIIGNTFSMSTARNLLFEGGEDYYVWNNTLGGLNPVRVDLGTPYGMFNTGMADTIDMRNNIFWTNLASLPSFDYALVHGYQAPSLFRNRDYNLYWTNGISHSNRNFTDFMVGATNYFYATSAWNTFKAAWTPWEANSPTPADPLFTDATNLLLDVSDESPAHESGVVLPYIIVTDALGVVDTVNKYDLNGKIRSRSVPNIGAYEFKDIDSTATDILTFTLTEQTGTAIINNTNHTISIEIENAADVTNQVPAITLSSEATISPVSGLTQNFTNPVTYTVTALDGITTQEWVVTITIQNPPLTPEVTTYLSGVVKSITASLSAIVTSDGGGIISERGVCYAETDTPTISNSKTTSDDITDAFDVDLVNLKSNTIYYYRGYATNENGTGYGDVLSFTTPVYTLGVSGGKVGVYGGKIGIIK